MARARTITSLQRKFIGTVLCLKLLIIRGKSTARNRGPWTQKSSSYSQKYTTRSPEYESLKVGQKAPRNQDNSAKVFNAQVLKILEKPHSNNIDLVVSSKLYGLKSCINKGTSEYRHINDGISWIMDHFGPSFWSQLSKEEQKFIRKITDYQHITKLGPFIQRTRNPKCLSVILEELIVRNELDGRSLIFIIMRLDLSNLMLLHQRLSSNSCLVKDWNTDANVRIKCEITLAFRYKMLKSRTMCRFLIDQYLETEWLPSLKTTVFNSLVFLRNMVYLLKGTMDNEVGTSLVLRYDIPSLTYCYWESSPDIYDIRFNLASVCNQLTIFQQVIVQLMNSSCISTNQKYVRKLCFISKSFKISFEKRLSHRNIIKFTSSLELLLSELRENINIDTEDGITLFRESLDILNNFKSETCNKTEGNICNQSEDAQQLETTKR